MIEEKQKILLVTMAEVDSAYEEDFNRWFNEEHLPALLKVPGVLSARRYRVVSDMEEAEASGPSLLLRYLTIYEHESIEVQKSEAYQKARTVTSPWSERVRAHVKNRARGFYVQIYP